MPLANLLHDLFFAAAENWFFSIIPAEQSPEKEPYESVLADEHYVQIDLKSLYIENSRKGISKFHGIVHSFIRVPHLDGGNLEFNVVTTPSQLKDLDGDHIDRIIAVNIPILGQVPFRGGGIQMQLGLFSVRSSDITTSVISLFTDMSEAAGVSFISTALPYTNFLKRGIGILAGSEKETNLEIGISTTISPIKTGYYVIMRAPKDKVDISKLSVSDNDFKLIDTDGKVFTEFPYLIYKISASPFRNDWFLIPEINAAYQRLKASLKNLQLREAETSLATFEAVLFASGDLLFQDAEKIFEQVKKTSDRIFAVIKTSFSSSTPVNRSIGANTSNGHSVEAIPELPELKDLNPFY